MVGKEEAGGRDRCGGCIDMKALNDSEKRYEGMGSKTTGDYFMDRWLDNLLLGL